MNELKPKREIIDYKTSDGVKVENGQILKIHYSIAYSLEALEKKELLDCSWGKEPITFTLGNGEVLKGIDEGLQGMRVYSTRRLIIPPELGFGKIGVPGKVKPNASLVVEVYLCSIE